MPALPLKAGEVRIEVHAAGLNYPDALLVQGLYQVKPDLPFVPGYEVAGVVIEKAADVAGYQVGDRVIAIPNRGAWAEEIVVAADRLMAMPAAMSFAEGAAMPMVYGTSLYSLKQRGELKPGETLLVIGAGGGVGLAAVEIGRAMGARVLAAASTEEKRQLARAHGADETIDYTKERLRDAVKRLTDGRGADVIFDPVGGDAFDEAIRSIAWVGRLLIIGFASGRIATLPTNLPLLKNCDVRGVTYGPWRNREPAEGLKNFEQLFDWYRAGKIKPQVTASYPLERTGAALQDIMDRRVTGKIVLAMR
ncbi:MAG: NADPH:quinone oxidoreductase family protein [Janthinobacterium lividum]